MTKKNLILGGIFAALLAVAFLWQGPIKDWRESLGQPDNILAGVDFDEVSRIEIDYLGQETALEKEGDKWKIAGTKGFYVQDAIINTIKSELDSAAAGEVEIVSENPDKKAGFSVDETTGAAVKLMQGDILLHEFIVGRTGSDFTSTYISLPDDDATYLVDANLSNAWRRGDWYDKTIFSFDAEQADKIRFQYPTREFTVEKSEDGWFGTLPYEFSVDEGALDDIVQTMAGLSAAEIPEQAFEGTGLEKNLVIIQVTGEEGLDHTLMIGDAREAGEDTPEEDLLYYAKRGDSDNIYLITAGDRENFVQTIGGLR